MAVNRANAPRRKNIVIVGCGPGAPEFITPAAKQAVAEADVVLGSKRLLPMFPERVATCAALPPRVEEALAAIAKQAEQHRVAVLVSGDPGVFSLAKAIVGRFGRTRCETIPAVSSLQVAFARLGMDWVDARIISAHGELPNFTAEQLASHEKLAVFAGTDAAVRWVGELARALAPNYALFLCENLTLENERVCAVKPAEVESLNVSSLAIFVLVRHGELAPDPRPDEFLAQPWRPQPNGTVSKDCEGPSDLRG